jgi:hypothetical protein
MCVSGAGTLLRPLIRNRCSVKSAPVRFKMQERVLVQAGMVSGFVFGGGKAAPKDACYILACARPRFIS